MLNLIKNLVRNEEGQDLAEYGIALAVIAIGAALIAVAIGTDVKTLWSNAQDDIHSAATANNPSINTAGRGWPDLSHPRARPVKRWDVTRNVDL
jgi:Flp pilus assembly pilin Flp